MSEKVNAILEAISRYQQANPPDNPYAAYAPGTPTLAARELTERGRQFDAQLAETQRANDMDYDIAQQNAAVDAYKASRSGSSGRSSGGTSNLNQWELKLLGSSQADSIAEDWYNRYKTNPNAVLSKKIGSNSLHSSAVSDNAKIDKTAMEQAKYPLYYTLKDILVNNKGKFNQIMADPVTVAENLILKTAVGTGHYNSIEDYFNRDAHGKELAKLYYEAKGVQQKQNDRQAALDQALQQIISG